MKRSTLAGIGLSVATLVLPASAVLQRPALAQPADSPLDQAASISLSPTAVQERRIRNAEQQQAAAQARLKKAVQEYEAAKNAAAELEHVLHALTQRAETSKASLSKAASHLDEEAEALALEQAGADARQKALEAAIAQQSKRAEAAVQKDEVAAELQKVVDARTAQAKRTEQMQATGAVANTDLDSVMAALAEARARLAERRQQTAATAGGAALAEWNKELLNLSVANAERHAKLKFLEDRRQGLAEALQKADDLGRYKDAMARADSARRSAQQEIEANEESLRNLRAMSPTTPTTKRQRD
jgi:chromosome segregation ATPase